MFIAATEGGGMGPGISVGTHRRNTLAFSNVSEAVYTNFCRHYSPEVGANYSLDAKKWQDLELGPYCASEYGSSPDLFSKSFQRALVGMTVGDTEDYSCPKSCEAHILKNDVTCGTPTSARIALCLMAYSNLDTYLGNIQKALEKARADLQAMIDKIATDFSPAGKPDKKYNKINIATALLVATSSILGVLPEDAGLIAAPFGIATSLTIFANGRSRALEADPKFTQAANISDAVGQIVSELSTGLGEYIQALETKRPTTTASNGTEYTTIEYVEQRWSIPGILMDGTFAHPSNSTLPPRSTDKSLRQALLSIAINYIWTQAKVIVTKFDVATGASIGWKGDDPCASGSGVPMFRGRVWCKGKSAYLLQTYVEKDPMGDEWRDKKVKEFSKLHEVPGFANLTNTEIDIAFQDVIEATESNYLASGHKQQTFPTGDGLLSQITHDLKPHNWMSFNLPFCDLTDAITRPVVKKKHKHMDSEIWLLKQAQCRCWRMPKWPHMEGAPKNVHDLPKHCD